MPADNRQSSPGREQEEPVLKRLASSGAANTGAALLGSVANFLLIVLVTRFWSTSDAGVLFAATSFFNIVLALAHLGSDQGMVRFIAWNSAHSGSGGSRLIIKVGMLPALAMAIFVMVICLVFGSPLSSMLGADDVTDGQALVWVLVAFLPVAVLYEQFLAVCRGFAVMRPTIVVERALRPILQVLLILAIGISGGGIMLLAVAWAIPYAVCLILAGAALLKVLKENPDHLSSPSTEHVAVVRDFWKFTAPRGLARLAQVMIQRSDVIVVTMLLGPAPAAVYTAATRFLVLGQVATSALQQVSEPQLAKLLSASRMKAVVVVTRQMTLWSIVFVWPVYLLFAVHAATFLEWVFGAEYGQGAPVLRVLCFAMLLATAIGPMDVLLLMAGRSSLSLMNVTIALILDLLLCLYLIPMYGIMGAGIAWAVAIIAKNVLCVWQVRRHLGVGLSIGALKMWLLSLVGIFGVAGSLAYLLPGQPWVSVGFSVLTGIFYLLFLWRKRSLLMYSGDPTLGG
ncbi:oligosaccharide flippase family protein [Glutamicibacter soli]|uniref:Oligosaccharide flippase family protein n=1 Tax=Glutamicibacter soli TaxID=453836 RepID=A0A6L9G741_9MICC|nr:polysaccharide biosynthesis C-terminal domain-containing protein [Glutamicibacter soli]NAZ16793.1 oligosaccharide flippase family protein [Glutamicibacter soli]